MFRWFAAVALVVVGGSAGASAQSQDAKTSGSTSTSYTVTLTCSGGSAEAQFTFFANGSAVSAYSGMICVSRMTGSGKHSITVSTTAPANSWNYAVQDGVKSCSGTGPAPGSLACGTSTLSVK
jgi:hypothetical protein